MTNAHSSKPQRSYPRLVVLLLELLLVAVLGAVIYSNWNGIHAAFRPDDSKGGNNVAEPSGDKAAEQEAFVALTKRKYLLVSERVAPQSPDHSVTSVNFYGKPVDDEALALVAKLYRVITVNAGGCKITDDQLKYFSNLSILNNMILSDTPITDAGLVHLRPLVNLGTLYLGNTQISDRGVADIAALTKLKILDLSKTKVGDEGLKKLLPLDDLNWLLLSETEITDAGLEHLAGMKGLGRLTIRGASKVTPDGISRLKNALPRLKVDQ